MTQQLPSHVGVIFDGNRRWAKAQGFDTAKGHQAGADRIFDFLSWCSDAGVDTVTLYLLSTENLAREPKELKALTIILIDVVEKIGLSSEYRANHVGTEEALPENLRDAINRAEKSTKNNTGLLVNMAIGYGGQQEIVDAVKRYLEAEDDLQKALENLDVKAISSNMYSESSPDLIIRTSGEKRLSGFMLWQSAYSELYFCDVMWPDFSQGEFERALIDFSGRKRRFGA